MPTVDNLTLALLAVTAVGTVVPVGTRVASLPPLGTGPTATVLDSIETTVPHPGGGGFA